MLWKVETEICRFRTSTRPYLQFSRIIGDQTWNGFQKNPKTGDLDHLHHPNQKHCFCKENHVWAVQNHQKFSPAASYQLSDINPGLILFTVDTGMPATTRIMLTGTASVSYTSVVILATNPLVSQQNCSAEGRKFLLPKFALKRPKIMFLAELFLGPRSSFLRNPPYLSRIFNKGGFLNLNTPDPKVPKNSPFGQNHRDPA